MARTGRPPVPLNWEQIAAMAQIQCTEVEIASVVGVSIETLRRQAKAKYGTTFVDFLRQKGAGGKASLRRAMWKAALGGDRTMMIWVSKNSLGFADKAEVKNDNTTHGEQSIVIGHKVIRF